MKFSKLHIIIFLALTSISSSRELISKYNSRHLFNRTNNYTIQVDSLPLIFEDKIIQRYQELKLQNQIVIISKYKPYQESDFFISIGIGLFENYEKALAYSIEKEFNYRIRKISIIISENNYRRILKSPTTLWLEQGNNYKDIYNFIPEYLNGKDLFYTQPLIFQQNNEVLFELNNKIISINLKDFGFKEYNVNKITNSFPQRSPSGKYIAYITENLWESESSLKILSNDSSYYLIDVKKTQKQEAIKNFHWHPSEDIIFYISGQAYGTLSVGGQIFACDLNSNNFLLIPRNPHKEEITINFQVNDEFLYYEIAHFDDNYNNIDKLEKKKISIAEITNQFKNMILK